MLASSTSLLSREASLHARKKLVRLLNYEMQCGKEERERGGKKKVREEGRQKRPHGGVRQVHELISDLPATARSSCMQPNGDLGHAI